MARGATTIPASMGPSPKKALSEKGKRVTMLHSRIRTFNSTWMNFSRMTRTEGGWAKKQRANKWNRIMQKKGKGIRRKRDREKV